MKKKKVRQITARTNPPSEPIPDIKIYSIIRSEKNFCPRCRRVLQMSRGFVQVIEKNNNITEKQLTVAYKCDICDRYYTTQEKVTALLLRSNKQFKGSFCMFTENGQQHFPIEEEPVKPKIVTAPITKVKKVRKKKKRTNKGKGKPIIFAKENKSSSVHAIYSGTMSPK